MDKRVKNAHGFFQTLDKQKSGVVPLNNFVKVAKMFGIQVLPSQIEVSEVGMVNYQEALERVQGTSTVV